MNDFLKYLKECWVGLAIISTMVLLAVVAIIHNSSSTGIEILTIDGCEYIRDTRHAVPVVHKANCKNH